MSTWQMSKGWIAVDLDGTLAEYHGWKGGEIGEPIPLMAARVRKWILDGEDVRIFTARIWPIGVMADVSSHRRDETLEQKEKIEQWCLKRIGKVLPVTCVKDFEMVELWDDRAVQVVKNKGTRVDGK